MAPGLARPDEQQRTDWAGSRRRNQVITSRERIDIVPGIEGPGHRSLAASGPGRVAVAPLWSSCAGSARSTVDGVRAPCKGGLMDVPAVDCTVRRK
eukprot:521737-Alexandrium_andersonii.AAC.1